MPSAGDVGLLDKATEAVRTLALFELGQLLDRFEGLSEREAVGALFRLLPELVRKWADLAGTVAADWFARERAASGVAGVFLPVPGSFPDGAAVERAISWAVRPVWDGAELKDVAPRLENVVGTELNGVAKRTIVENAERDPVTTRVALVPEDKACAWCVMLASRGAVYHDEGRALANTHDDCRCQVVPVREGTVMPDSYDLGAYRAAYNQAVRMSSSGSRTEMLSNLRRVIGSDH